MPRRLFRLWITAYLLGGAVSISDAAGTKTPAFGVCEAEMWTASKTFDIPLPVLYAVGLTETGRRGKLHPFALNVEGQALFPASKTEALRLFEESRARGKKLIDLGCMQVNHHYHGNQFHTPGDMLDPHQNVTYAARFLTLLKRREGTWAMAIARYHAGPKNDPAQRRYICKVIDNLVATGFGRWTPSSRRFCSRR